MRLIDADSLISDLEEWKENPNNDDSAVDLVNHFIGIIRATPSAYAVPQSEQYKKGFEDAKRAFLVEYARESKNMRKRNAQLEVMLNAQKAISADAEQGYTEWLEKIIVDNEGANEWLCEDTPDLEWCEKNCHYSSIQAECLRHLYEVSKGGDAE